MLISIICLVVSFGLTVGLGPFVIKIMRKFKVQNVQREYLSQNNNQKALTPSMGGLMFIIPIILASLALGLYLKDINYYVLGILVLFYGTIGFLDDFLKVKYHRKDGLSWYTKMIGQFLIAVAFSLYLNYFTDCANVSFRLFGVDYEYSMGLFYIPFVIFLLIAESNGTNITDGLDGLVGGTSAMVFLFLSLVGLFVFDNSLVSNYSALFLGGVLGFLVYNVHPAKIFMGDVGSLTIGAIMGSLALFLKHPFIILYVGLLYAIEIITDLLQFASCKIRHKRIIPRAPVHHTFQEFHWPEKKIVYVFYAFTAICVVATYLVCVIKIEF